MYSKTLVLCGHFKGATKVLAKQQFVDGRITLYGSPRSVESLALYLGRCYQAFEVGSDALREKQIELGECDPETSEGSGEPDQVPGDVSPSAEGPADSAPVQRSEPTGAEAPDRGTEDYARRRQEMIAAVGLMDQNNHAQWTNTGQPKLKVLEDLLNRPLTRAEVDKLLNA